MTDDNCEICGKPATRVIDDLERIPDESFWCIEPEDGPWYFCDEHAGEDVERKLRAGDGQTT